ncbi:hypothetical protein MRB53_034636 [Persea americana]|uniref:Uncharacterized protein n=1 Tax=Persea americana TaxID=3435 RepID=A0ACC2K2C4_PERAE|nr:hypothetical protein MRB53_034636 [Persea americana]
MEPESVEGHTSTPADNINEPDVIDIFSTPRQHATTSQAVIVSPTRASIDSLVWRLKRLPRTRKIPEKFDDYLHSMGGSEYSLSKRDRFLMKGFKQYFNTSDDVVASHKLAYDYVVIGMASSLLYRIA